MDLLKTFSENWILIFLILIFIASRLFPKTTSKFEDEFFEIYDRIGDFFKNKDSSFGKTENQENYANQNFKLPAFLANKELHKAVIYTILFGLVSGEILSYTGREVVNFEYLLNNPSFYNFTTWIIGIIGSSLGLCIIPLIISLIISLIFRKRWYKVYCTTLFIWFIIALIPQINDLIILDHLNNANEIKNKSKLIIID